MFNPLAWQFVAVLLNNAIIFLSNSYNLLFAHIWIGRKKVWTEAPNFAVDHFTVALKRKQLLSYAWVDLHYRLVARH